MHRSLTGFTPVTILALLATLVVIFAFQAHNIIGRYFHVALIAVPILPQVYFKLLLGLRPDEALPGGAHHAATSGQRSANVAKVK